jgi:hypothetical protein
VFAQGERQLVPQAEWKHFVRNAIRAFPPLLRNPGAVKESAHPGAGRLDDLRPAAEVGRVDNTANPADDKSRLPYVRYSSEYEIDPGHVEWDPAEKAQLRRYRSTELLVDNFTRCSEQRLNARWRQNRTTRTFIPEDARRFGLRLHGGSLFIYRVEGNDKRGLYVRSEADFDKAMDWVQAVKKSPWQTMHEITEGA